MSGIITALWTSGIVMLTMSLLWRVPDEEGDRLPRLIAMLGFLYVALATLLTIT